MAHSPLPKITKKIFSEHKPKGMSFSEAMKQVINGKAVRRLEWEDPEYYCFLTDRDGYDDKLLCIHCPKDEIHEWFVRDCDMLPKDWIVAGAKVPIQDKESQSGMSPS